MSVEALNWALTVPVGGNEKVILLGLANHAHPDGTYAYPTLGRLSVYAHCDRSTARRNLRKLEKAGYIERHGDGPNGQACWSLKMDLKQGGSKMPSPSQNATPGVAPAQPPGGSTDATRTIHKEPSINHPVEADASTKRETDPDAIRLCGVLATLMRENDSKVKLPNKGTNDHEEWIKDMRLLVRKDRDGDVAEVEAVIRWSQADDFWRTVIFTPKKLRKHFLRMKMKSEARAVADQLRGTPEQRARLERTERRLRVINSATDQPTHPPLLEEHNVTEDPRPGLAAG